MASFKGTARRHVQGHDNTRIDHILDLTLFTPEHLKTGHGFSNALVALDRFWWQDELEPLEFTVRELMAGPHNLFAYTVAIVLDEARYDRLLSTLRRTFPTTSRTFTSSLACDLINHLRDFYIRMISLDVPRSLVECHRAVVLASSVLSVLNDLKFDLELPLSAEHSGFVACKQSQRSNKHFKRKIPSANIPDLTPFLKIGVEVPCTITQATELAQQILNDQKGVLQEYLRVLRLPNLASAIEGVYISPEIATGPRSMDQHPTSRVSSEPINDTTVMPPAYPQIQPLKAARYFSEPADGFGHWNLLLSSRAIQHLKGFHRDKEQWRLLKKKMQELSNGFFSDSNQKKLRGSDQGIPVYEAKVTRDLRIIYQIDLAPDDAKGNDHQIIKIWGIHTHAQMDSRLWKSIFYHQSRIGGEYRLRCLYRETPKRPGVNVTMPASWGNIVEKLPTDTFEDFNTSMSTEEQLELHSILALEKFTRMSQALMNSIVTGQDDTYAFELTGPEQQIRDHPSSCVVLGRSGTGKTTTMVFKMIAREMLSIQQATEGDDTGASKYRQLFVTQSRILARRVQEYFGKMLLSQSAGQKTSQEIKRLALRSQRASSGDDMLDTDEDEEDERSDLPKKFSELEDQHFPLFLTVDQLYKLLESDCNLSFKSRPRTKEHCHAEQKSRPLVAEDDMMDLDDEDLAKDDDIVNVSSSSERSSEKASIITFETFLYTYWPHLPQPLTKGLDPALVWNEFMGVIKGSEESLDTKDGSNFLDKSTYLGLSHRRQSTFAKQRERIYEIFQNYVRLKRRREDYDAADRTHAILKALNGDIPGGRKVDFLYVDEAQDNLIVDARLIRNLCGNPYGLFWAGDTAQTISTGSSFRFDDLKAFLYRLEQQTCGSRVPEYPTSFQLAINYRSHGGVVNCAHSVIELITEFWPDSLDLLARERGVVDGPQPIFFCGWDPKVTRYEQFLFHDAGNIEFGAQQCIIVRDENAREQLRRKIGDVGLIMTLYESKGLEFDDVLLFNFFADSMASIAEWRVILNVVEESKRGNVGAPRFDETKHSSLCFELKSLYVGITRARCNVWILDAEDQGDAKGEPMRVYWESKNLVKVCRPGDPVPELAVRSTPDQWAQQGRALFKTKHYQLAIFCFERAGLVIERCISHAYLLRRTANRTETRHKKAAYFRAAEAFVVCRGLSSASLFERSKHLLSLGGDCFVEAGAHVSAAQAYLGAERFTKAAQQFKIARLFDEAVDVVLLHPGCVDRIVSEKCLGIAKLHFYKERQFKKAERLFDSVDAQLLYLEEYGFDLERAIILENLGRFNEAAEIHYAEGKYLDAISLWTREGDPESRRRAGVKLLDSLWKTLPFGAQPDKTQCSQARLFELLNTLGAEFLEENQRDESAMFRAIFAQDLVQLLRLARNFYHGHNKNPTAALVCFDHAFSESPRMFNENAQKVARYLEDYILYTQLMRQVVLETQKTHAGQWSQTAKLLGFVEMHDGTVGAPLDINILPCSILYERFVTDDASRSREEGITTTITSLDLSQVIRDVLKSRMLERLEVQGHGAGLLHARSFRPCLNFVVSGNCGRVECPNAHLSSDSLDVEAFNLLTRLHMQQVLIVSNMDLLLDPGVRRKYQRIWQERIYETLHPVFSSLGHISVLNTITSSRLRVSSIPEYQRAIQMLSVWIHDRLRSLQPYRGDLEDKFLTDAVQTIQLAYSLDRANARFTWEIYCVKLLRPAHLQRNGNYILHDLLTFLQASSNNSVSSGVYFIKHILDHKIKFEVNTLLNNLEAVIARAIMAVRPLDQLTLPRSWIVGQLSHWDERCRICDISIVCLIFDPLAELLEGIYSNSGVDHLTYGRFTLSSLLHIQTIKNVLIFRICRCVALLGYNVGHFHFREKIRKTLSSLRKPGRHFSSMVYQYVTADEWYAVARAVRSSVQSPLDELVHLRKRETVPNRYYPRVPRLLLFDSEEELLPALEYVAASKFNPEAKVFIPSTLMLQSAPLPETEPVEDDPVTDDSVRYDAIVVEAVAPSNLSIERTDAEIKAAGIIQRFYRRTMIVKSSSNSETEASRFYTECQAEVDKLPEAVSLSYRCMFLGPLPHVLAALYGCKKAVKTKKKKVMKILLGSTPNPNLEETHEMITKCHHLIKTCEHLLKVLQPPSESHREGLIDKLRRAVEAVNVFVKETIAVTELKGDVLRDMTVGYKGIVRIAPPLPSPPPTAKAPKRPALNTEDIEF